MHCSVKVLGSLLLVAILGRDGHSQEVKQGLEPGNQVPISSMRSIIGEPKDRNTCFAGKYRGLRAISIYIWSTDEPNVNALVTKINKLVGDQKNLRGYVLVLAGSQFDSDLHNQLFAWSKKHNLGHLDLAVSNVSAQKVFELERATGVTIVYADKRLVKYHQAVAAGKLDAAALEKIGAELDRLTRE